MQRDFDGPGAVPDAERDEQDGQARLALGFADDGGVTRLVERAHFGPLRVQKPLYPEGGQVCHAIIVHPPGGVVGGDQLAISARAARAASAFITTPGAAKWYKANGNVSRQQVRLEVGARATLEWMPQETIFFDAAVVELTHDITLAQDARYIGCEILCFGRTGCGESFQHGRIAQSTAIRRDGRLIWFEQGVLAGQDAALQSPFGLAGKTVCATLIAAGAALPAALLQALRDEAVLQTGGVGAFGVSQTKAILAARYLGDSSETARRVMLCVWRHLRPPLIGRAGVTPRIWDT